jgi:FtsH-binding integral membrane protein
VPHAASEADTIRWMSNVSQTAAAAPTERRSFSHGLRSVVICSLLVTLAAAIVATLVAAAAPDLRWSVAFVVARWLCVAALLVTPLLHQVVVRLGGSWRMPWVLQTPATALLLTTESILLDILSARLG